MMQATSSDTIGLDSGCVYGGQLTACVLPPAAELRARAGGVEGAPTLRQLGGRLVAVEAAAEYEVKKKGDKGKKEKGKKDKGKKEKGAACAADTVSSSLDD